MLAALFLLFSSSRFAWWSDNNNGWEIGWNNWLVWTPMSWVEEALGDNDRYRPYGYSGYGGRGW
ncbi:MAG: hypothetical protein RQ936_12395 [Gammaproteobacteria bacterium]|nr:hypothetical protein [Gammaproteobacteria bacterium]